MKLHIHSDNASWAGSENMPGVFLSSYELNNLCYISFSYRYSKEYEKGMKHWVSNLSKSDCELCHHPVCSSAGQEPPEKPYACLRIEPVRRPMIIPMKLWVSFLYKVRKYFKPIMILKYVCMIEEIWKFYKLFKEIKPDILHINNGGYPGATSCNSAAIAGKLAGVKGITYMINSTTIKNWWEYPIRRAIEKSVTKFISASKDLQNKTPFLNAGWNWEIIPNTLRPDIEPRFTQEEVRQSFIDKGRKEKIFFVACGVDDPRKGFDTLRDAFGRVTDKMNGDRKAFLFISHNGNDTLDLISACDWLVVPSIRDEDFPNVILMARKYNKRVIATDIGGIKEMMTKADHLVAPNDVCDLAFAICESIYLDGIGQSPYKDEPFNKWINEYQPGIVINRYLSLWKEML